MADNAPDREHGTVPVVRGESIKAMSGKLWNIVTSHVIHMVAACCRRFIRVLLEIVGKAAFSALSPR
jgi:hypothetical protein